MARRAVRLPTGVPRRLVFLRFMQRLSQPHFSLDGPPTLFRLDADLLDDTAPAFELRSNEVFRLLSRAGA